MPLDMKGTGRAAFMVSPAGPIGAPVNIGQGSGCDYKGNPRFFLWLPLAQLMHGSSWLARGMVAVRLAAWGWWDGLTAVLAMPPLRALHCA